MNPKRWLLLIVILGVVSLVAFIFGRLAMTDIFHGEPDLTLEWKVVSATFLPVLIFHLVAIVAGIALLRQISQKH